MDIDVQVEGDAIVAAVRGRVDTISAPAFEKAVLEFLNGPEKLVVFDLSGLEYISSAGLRVVISVAKKLKSKGGEVRLAATSGPVKKVFQVSGFFSMLKNYETRSAALAEI